MFSSASYDSMYKRFLGPLAQDIVIMVNNGTDYDSYSTTAHVSRYSESDLVQGGPIEIGDLRVIVLAENMPTSVTRLDKGDRVEIDGRPYAVVHFDDYTRKMGSDQVAYQLSVRG